MDAPTPVNSPTILGLANDINNLARNVRRRIGSLADSLGGSIPECAEKSALSSSDLHSELQRVVTILQEVKDDLTRCEKVVGVCPAEELKGSCDVAAPPRQTRY